MLKGKKIDAFFKRKRGDSLDEPTATEAMPIQPTDCVQPPLLLLEFEQHGPHPSMPQQQGQSHQTQTNEVQFQGIEFLQRDPALRPQIWQYPPNQRDDVRRAYLKLGIMQPRMVQKVANDALSMTGSRISHHGWSTRRTVIVHIASIVSCSARTKTREVVQMSLQCEDL